ncbi:MAG: hypothetical protein KJ983_02755, partial [Candidatus Omnitrophica bacterium]|nr:hypothetical protein [Candidatus Omnitrophota bacterium]
MINFYEASNFIAAVVNVVVAVFILVRGCRIRLCQIWTIFAFCVAISGFGAYMATSASAYDSTFFWWRIAHAGVIMLPVFLTVFVIILVMRPFDNFLRKSLFQKKYNYKHFLKTFTDEILTVIGFNSLCGHAVNKLAEIMRLNHVTLFFYSDEDIRYNLVATTLSKSKIPLTYLEPKEPLVRHMTQSREHLHRVDVERNACKDKQIDDILKLFDTNFVIPLFRQEKMIGILFLGNKKSGKGFTQDDSDILLPLAKTLSVAVTNAQLFTELSKAQAQAAQREKMAVIGTLSAGLNHEICNPLGIARGQCELFLLNVEEGVYQDKTLEELLAKAQEIMQKVIHEVDRATLMTRKLSSFAKPSKCEILDNVDVGKEFSKTAKEMFYCYDMYGAGKWEIFNTDSGTYCAVCAVLKYKRKSQ